MHHLKFIEKEALAITIFVIVVVALVATFLLDNPLNQLQAVFAGDESRLLLSSSVFGILITIGTALAPLSFLPVIPFAAEIVGPFEIFVATVLGWTVGGAGSFLIARHRPAWVEYVYPLRQQPDFHNRFARDLNLWSMIPLRMFLPVDALSYFAGLHTRIRLWEFGLGTFVGVLPLAFILTYSEDAIVWGQPALLFALIVAVLGIGAAYGFVKFSRFYNYKTKIYTHSEEFHSDDVFAVAAVELFLSAQGRRYEVIRTRDTAVIEQAKHMGRTSQQDTAFVLDIGREYEPAYDLFDHHQPGGAGKRDNGHPYSTIGIVWKEYGETICGSAAVAERIDQKLVTPIDLGDVGIETYRAVHSDVDPFALHDVINSFLPSMYAAPQDYDRAFGRAVRFAKKVLQQLIHSEQEKLAAEQTCDQLYQQAADKRLIVMDDHYYGRKHFEKYPEPLYVVAPRTEPGRWMVIAVEEASQQFVSRKDLPEAWAGKEGSELQKVTGVDDAVFCHNSRFIAVAGSKEGAMALAKLALAGQDTAKKPA